MTSTKLDFAQTGMPLSRADSSKAQRAGEADCFAMYQGSE